jgi:hypothetical protein
MLDASYKLFDPAHNNVERGYFYSHLTVERDTERLRKLPEVIALISLV